MFGTFFINILFGTVANINMFNSFYLFISLLCCFLAYTSTISKGCVPALVSICPGLHSLVNPAIYRRKKATLDILAATCRSWPCKGFCVALWWLLLCGLVSGAATVNGAVCALPAACGAVSCIPVNGAAICGALRGDL